MSNVLKDLRVKQEIGSAIAKKLKELELGEGEVSRDAMKYILYYTMNALYKNGDNRDNWRIFIGYKKRVYEIPYKPEYDMLYHYIKVISDNFIQAYVSVLGKVPKKWVLEKLKAPTRIFDLAVYKDKDEALYIFFRRVRYKYYILLFDSKTKRIRWYRTETLQVLRSDIKRYCQDGRCKEIASSFDDFAIFLKENIARDMGLKIIDDDIGIIKDDYDMPVEIDEDIE